MMPPLRRLTALATSLLLAHLAWLGSGIACDMATMGQAGGAAMAAMDMPVEVAGVGAPRSDAAGMSRVPSGATAEHHHAPCDFPWSADGCRSTAPCAPMALASMSVSLRASDAAQPSVAAVGVLTPPSTMLPPELPPPRA